MVRLLHAARTDVGMIRSGNEDNFAANASGDRGVFIVADGMGGHAAGEVASEMAVQTVERELRGVKDLEDKATAARLTEAPRPPTARSTTARSPKSTSRGMGTTASVAHRGRHQVSDRSGRRLARVSPPRRRAATAREGPLVRAGAGRRMDSSRPSRRYHPTATSSRAASVRVPKWSPTSTPAKRRSATCSLVASDGPTGMVDDRRLQMLPDVARGAWAESSRSFPEANGRGGSTTLRQSSSKSCPTNRWIPQRLNHLSAIMADSEASASRRLLLSAYS